jgi:intergrase/recombinase
MFLGRKGSVVRPPGFGPGSTAWKADHGPTLAWTDARKDFLDYLKAQEYDVRTGKDMVSYLDRYSPVIAGPLDVNSLFSRITVAKRHVVLGLRVLFNFYETLGVDKGYLDCLRKALPRIQCGVDLKIPAENKILESLQRLVKAPAKYQALYNLLLDSGLRLIEGIELIRNFEEAESVKGFYRCDLAMFRGEKQAYYGHFTESTLGLIESVKGAQMEECATSHYFCKYGYVTAKYLRKFAFDKMIELEVPESVADFIEGRVPKRVGAKHYMALARQATKFYPRYARYITKLTQKAVN